MCNKRGRMKTGICLFVVILLILAPKGFTEPDPRQLLGQWYTEKKEALFEFYQVEEEYRAKMVPLRKPEMVDTHNPVDSLRNRKLAGVTTIKGLRYNPQKKRFEGGSVYNPENGKIYHCHCRLSEDGTKLSFRGYLGVVALGQTQVWIKKE